MDNRVTSVLFLLALLLLIWLNRTGKLGAVKKLIRDGNPGAHTVDTPYGPIYGIPNGDHTTPRQIPTPYGPIYGVPRI